MTIKAVLFDLDGTLLDRDSSLLAFVNDQYDRMPAFQAVEKEQFVQRFIELDNHGYVWKDKVYQQLIEEFEIADVDWADCLHDYVSSFQQHCIGFANLQSMLAKLKEHDIKIALISNGFGQFQYDNFKALNIEHLFDEVLISEWEGLRKPDPAIFHRALTKLGVTAEDALFVGDHPDNDIRASREVGMRAVWKRSAPYESVEHANAVIDDLEELITIVLP
ncbi:putative hydrolase of the HAD superfamily [Paenibacillus cellulosilyticus]|uniref:Putative hydrolase of the HAD superfamily n=1 Tax=Paenibacillus cellulosilyticus TaxID=375489 RepID=A0A2V2YH51_9BACL|nr:HAD family hydrolase [Paenibacillus cellulosilyticus]PWV92440.1 putative hydrolase of the HAD superfamily [Paenibacillus cellulosilyticus]QKS47017.1 HAD family hydrolase [Paenibacillus cellulosilyticus]